MTLTVKRDLFWSNVRAFAKFRNKSEHTWSYKTPQDTSIIISNYTFVNHRLVSFELPSNIQIFGFIFVFESWKSFFVIEVLLIVNVFGGLYVSDVPMFHDHQVSAVKVTSKFYSVSKQLVN